MNEIDKTTETMKILERETIADKITHFLKVFPTECKNTDFKKGIYIYGPPGCGKTFFVDHLLTRLNYDIIKYDTSDIRNKSLFDTITNNNISNCNVLHMMNRTKKKIVIVMDEIDGMNKGDKGGITSLIKLIRQKKTKKQRLENVSMNPIICIGNYAMDKKIKELMKVCTVFELKAPTYTQIQQIFQQLYLQRPSRYLTDFPKPPLIQKMVRFIQGDMQKLQFMLRLYEKATEPVTEEMLDSIFYVKSMNSNSKKITELLLTAAKPMSEYASINETDRTIIALLWHENIADTLPKTKSEAIPFYHHILGNICYSDFIDRITFQNQIWQFNEMSFLMKTCYNTKLLHDTFPKNGWKPGSEIRFTKILTKYSTEYNNQLFIYNLCQRLDMDKKDLVAFFQEWKLRVLAGENPALEDSFTKTMERMMETHNINKLDIKRMYRFIEKNVMKEIVVDDISEDDDEGD
jgi:DNA polymerase III delta prime subunit